MKSVGDFVSLFTFVATPAEIEYDRRRLEAEHDMAFAAAEISYPLLSGTRCTRVTWQEDDMAKQPIGPREARLRELREARVARNRKVIDRKVKPAGTPKGKKRGRG